MKPLILYKSMLPYATLCIMAPRDGTVECILGLIPNDGNTSRPTVGAETRLNTMKSWNKACNHTRLRRSFIF
jgi:hypothetical protein